MLLLDAHVHYYPCFDQTTFFQSAFNNFESTAISMGLTDYTPIIILADWSKICWFQHFFNLGNDDINQLANVQSPFTFEPTEEELSVSVSFGSKKIIIVAGRKIITAENLEVLALCTNNRFKDGLTLNETVVDIASKNAVPIIPWAAGKWLGKRGEILLNLIGESSKNDFLLCDNGNRPNVWKYPNHFKIAEKKGFRIISGSDPLHFPSEVNRTGSFGFCIDKDIDLGSPANDIKQILSDPDLKTQHYGKLESFSRFIRNQAIMQLFGRKWKKELMK